MTWFPFRLTPSPDKARSVFCGCSDWESPPTSTIREDNLQTVRESPKGQVRLYKSRIPQARHVLMPGLKKLLLADLPKVLSESEGDWTSLCQENRKPSLIEGNSSCPVLTGSGGRINLYTFPLLSLCGFKACREKKLKQSPRNMHIMCLASKYIIKTEVNSLEESLLLWHQDLQLVVLFPPWGFLGKC